MKTYETHQVDRLPNWRDAVLTVARLLCDCDGRRWGALPPFEQDRYGRIAALVLDTVAQIRSPRDSPKSVN